MQEPINKTQGDTPSTNTGAALLTGAAILGGAALHAHAQAKSTRAVSPPITFEQIPGTGDIKVLNYALALEILEANLYVQALKRLTTGGTNALNQTIVGLNVPSSDAFAQYLAEFGQVEAQHRDFLKSALGANAISNSVLKDARFDFNINSYSAETLLDLLIAVEDTGTNAYIGAVQKFTPGSQYLPTAAAIQGTEARHTAALIVVRNRKYPSKRESPAPLASENGGRDVVIREGAQKGLAADPNTVLEGVSPFIVLASDTSAD